MFVAGIGRQAICRADFWSPIFAMWMTNRILCVCVPFGEAGIFEARVDLGKIGLGGVDAKAVRVKTPGFSNLGQ